MNPVVLIPHYQPTHAASSQMEVAQHLETEDQPYLPPNLSREQLDKPVKSLIYLRSYIPVVTPGSVPQLLRPFLEGQLIEYKDEPRRTATVAPEKRPPLNAFVLFRMVQSMHLVFSPSGRPRSSEKIISKLISVYWRILTAAERDEWYLLADDLKLVKEIKRTNVAAAIEQCSQIALKFAARPYITPSRHSLDQIDGKIGPRLRLPSAAAKSSKQKHVYSELRPMIQARVRDARDAGSGNKSSNATIGDQPALSSGNSVSLELLKLYQPSLPPISDLISYVDAQGP